MTVEQAYEYIHHPDVELVSIDVCEVGDVILFSSTGGKYTLGTIISFTHSVAQGKVYLRIVDNRNNITEWIMSMNLNSEHRHVYLLTGE